MIDNPTPLMEAQRYCEREDIQVYPVAITNTKCMIEISYKDKPPKRGKKVYNSKGGKTNEERWWKVIHEILIDYHLRSL